MIRDALSYLGISQVVQVRRAHTSIYLLEGPIDLKINRRIGLLEADDYIQVF